MWPGSSSHVLSLGRRAGKPRQPTDLTVEQVLHTYRRLQRRCVAGLSWGCRRSVDQRSRSIPCMDRRPVDVKSMSEPQPYSIMSHVDEVSESPGPTSPVVDLSSVMTDVSAVHEHTSVPTRSGPVLRLDLDRHGGSDQIGACPGRWRAVGRHGAGTVGRTSPARPARAATSTQVIHTVVIHWHVRGERWGSDSVCQARPPLPCTVPLGHPSRWTSFSTIVPMPTRTEGGNHAPVVAASPVP